MGLLIRERPPLRLSIGVKTPSGYTTRWGIDDPRPENVPGSLTFATTLPGGFDLANLTLPRLPRLNYPDLEEFSDITIRGVCDQVAYEGRVDTTPRTSGDQYTVAPGIVGWQAHLDANEDVQMIYVCQNPSLWTDAPLTEQLRVSAASISYGDMSWSSQNGGLVCALPNQEIDTSVTEIWFIAPAGVLIGKAMYIGQDTSMPSGWEDPALLSHSDLVEDPATSDALTFDGTLRTIDCSSPDRAVSMRVFSNGVTATPASGAQRAVSAIGVYGNHGLTTQPIDSSTPDGLLASDVIAHALATWAPLVNFTTGAGGTIQPSSFVIPHLVFTTLPTKVSDVITAALQYELLDWAIWEDRTFYMNERGARGTEWQARVAPSGLSETGPQSTRIWNSTVVQYQDVDGTQRTVGPPGSGCDTEDSSLVDPDPLNPANEAGETRRAVTAMGTGTSAGAIQVGARFLQEQKLLDTSGQANIVGHIQDPSAVWSPAWKMRAGDTVRFIDAHDTSARRIVKTSYDDSSKTNSLTLDSPPDGLTDLLARLSISIVETGLS